MRHSIAYVILATVLAGISSSACAPTASTNANQSNASIAVSSPVKTPVVAEVTPTPGQPQNILFIIDSSGSMKAKTGGKTKMDAAKEVVTQLVKDLPPGTNAGLMAYGHREKNDCKDVELLMPVGPVDAAAFSEKVNALQPIGQTPISYSIRRAASVLFPVKGKKTVILISDGEETCKEDPCAVAADLKKADVELKIHVVGFGIDKPAARKQLECIANATGGLYKDAGDAAELKQTLEGLAKADESTSGKGRLITVALDSNGKETNWKMDVSEPAGRSVASSPYSSPLEVPAGKYDVWYGRPCSPDVWKRGVEIKSGEDTRIELEQLGRVRPSVHDANGKDLAGGGFIEVYLGDTRLCMNMRGGTELPPGTYDFRFWSPQLLYGWSRGVEIKAGQETPMEILAEK